jgi:TonB-linked SusC/RagA family outer membrane protein
MEAVLKRFLYLLLPLTLLAGVQDAWTQQREVTGTVVTEGTNAPVAGATVTFAGTTRGVTTDAQGNFRITVPAGDARLRVSMVGHRSRDIVVPATQTSLRVTLQQDVLGLDELVVTGQATTVARRNLANAVATISAQDVERAPAQSIDRALQGKIAGANITANSGAPGGGIQVNLRGVSSINGTAEPLWVIDGVIVSNVAIASGQNAVTRASPGTANATVQDAPTNRIADLNPDDIESIEILKGASAAAIYGSKASNGVIIVTTKRGRSGAPRVSMTQQFGYYQLSNKIGAREYTLEEALQAYPTNRALVTQLHNSGQRFDHEAQLAGRRDLSTQTSLNVSGGSGDTRYFVSGLVQNDEGIIAGTGFEKQSFRLNLDQRLSSRVEVGVNSNVVHSVANRGLSNNDNSGTSFYVVLAGTPNFVDLSPGADGVYPFNPLRASNPLQTAALMRNDEDVWRVISVGNVKVDLFGNDNQSLRFLATGGADYFQQENRLFFPPELQFESRSPQPGTSLRGESSNTNLNATGNLVHTFNPASGAFTATTSAGVQYEDRDLNIVRLVGRNLIAGQSNVDAATSIQAFTNRQRVRDFGIYVQEELLMLDNRLLLTGSLRADRSSANGDPDQYFYYPKTAASYRLPGFVGFVDELKVRAAYGRTGNQPLFGQKFTPLSATNSIQGLPGLVVGGIAGDPDIRPEQQREIEGGFDVTLLDSRATFEFTVYNQRITDLLLQRTVAPSTGFTTQFFNGGELSTRGLEMALAATPVRFDNFNWFTRTTFYQTRSTIENLPVPSFRTGAFGSTSLGVFQIEEGKSATQIVGRNGRDERGQIREEALGDATPDFKMGFTNEFTLGAFSLYSLFDWQKGGDIINLTKLLYDLGQNSPDFALPAGVTTPRPISECHPNCSGRERVTGFGTFTQQYIEDGSFVKLREVSLGYQLPQNMLSRIPGQVQNARIALSGRNVLTWTNYTGLDPEVSNFGNQPIARSVDVAPFPPSRSFWLSFNLGF